MLENTKKIGSAPYENFIIINIISIGISSHLMASWQPTEQKTKCIQ
jgi:hypothetical protein